MRGGSLTVPIIWDLLHVLVVIQDHHAVLAALTGEGEVKGGGG